MLWSVLVRGLLWCKHGCSLTTSASSLWLLLESVVENEWRQRHAFLCCLACFMRQMKYQSCRHDALLMDK